MTGLADRLAATLRPGREYTAMVVRAVYQPVGGHDRTVFPPTYPLRARGDDPNTAYLTGDRLVDGGKRTTVVMDQEPSQANRVEEALREARDDGLLQLPLFELRFQVPHRAEIRLTSLDFPHRYADAYLRDCQIGRVRFDDSVVGSRLRTATTADVRPLYQREPCSLIFGAWDSHRKGRWSKFARLYSATMYGLDPVLHGPSHAPAEPGSSARFGFFFEPDGWDGEPVNREPHKHTEMLWTDPGDLPPRGVSEDSSHRCGSLPGGAG